MEQTSTDHPAHQPPRRRWWRWLLGLLALLLALGAAWYFWLARVPWHLAGFDHAKATQLAPAQRAAYEKELFGEVLHWFRPTRRYPTWEPNYYLPREQRWLEMANEGFELAHIVLRVVQPGAGKKYNAGPAFRRLEELAEQGDQGAMCLMQSLSIIASPRDVTPQIDERARYWMIKGGELGHPECLLMWGSRLLVGSDGQPRDPERGKALIFESIRKGYVHGLGVMALYYEEQGYADFSNIKRIYCWDYWGSKIYQAMEPLKSAQYSIEKEAPADKRAELLDQLNGLRDWNPAVEECVAMSKED